MIMYRHHQEQKKNKFCNHNNNYSKETGNLSTKVDDEHDYEVEDDEYRQLKMNVEHEQTKQASVDDRVSDAKNSFTI